jgi:hypothetical protein
MIFDAWRDVVIACTRRIAETTHQVNLMMQEAWDENTIEDARHLLDLQKNLLDAMVAAYLKEVRDGTPRD